MIASNKWMYLLLDFSIVNADIRWKMFVQSSYHVEQAIYICFSSIIELSQKAVNSLTSDDSSNGDSELVILLYRDIWTPPLLACSVGL